MQNQLFYTHTHTHLGVFVNVCRYIWKYINLVVLSVSYMKRRNSIEEFWQWTLKKQQTASWEKDNRKMPPKRIH